MKIKTKINVGFLGLFCLILVFIIIIVGFFTTSLIKKNTFAYIESSNRARAEHIRTFLQDQKKESLVLAGASVYIDFLKEPTDSKQYKIIKSKIDNRFLRTIEADNTIKEVFILDSTGKIVASSNKNNEGLDRSNDEYFLNSQKDTFMKGIYLSDITKKINFTISSPIFDEQKNLIGISVLRYLPDKFFEIVKSENGLGDTEENFLLNNNKILITPSRFLTEDQILKKKIETENSENCFDKKEIEYITKYGYLGRAEKFGSQILFFKDYRGMDVVGTHAYIPETGWCLITKIDKNQVFSTQTSLIYIFIIIFCISLILILIVGLFISKKITNPIKILKLGAERILQNKFDYKTKLDTKDELGDLSRAFDLMVSEVNDFKYGIEQKVKEKTNEIEEKSKETELQKSAILNILEDVQKEKIKVELLATDLEKFKLAVDNASDQVVIADSDGIVIYGNKAVKNITGYTPEEALGKKAGSLWKKPMSREYYDNMWRIIRDEKSSFVSEIENRRKNGDLYIANISISPVLNNKNEIIYFVAIEHDITKEKEIDKAKSEFVSLASHQLRTPLSSINWYTEMLLAGDAGAINEEQKKYLNEVAIGNQRMVELVDSLLNVSRLDLGTFVVEPEILNPIEVSKNVLLELKPKIIERKLKIEEIYDEKINEFKADKKLFRIILQNLLSNAVKYTSMEGFVKISISSISKDQIFEDKKMKEESIIFSISDNGIGIPSNQQEKMFSKLFRADNAREQETEGTGLGLYILKSIIDQSGGDVWFKSEENKGTTFFVVFPMTGMKKKEGLKRLD